MILDELLDLAVELLLEPVFRALERGTKWIWRTTRGGVRRLLRRGDADG